MSSGVDAPSKKPRHVIFSQKSSEWETPDALYEFLDVTYHFDLDACATKENAKCDTYYTQETDGLEHRWIGSVFCNPPYGRGISRWLAKGRSELTSGHCDVVVYLLPARTDTTWFHRHVWDHLAHHPRTGVELQLLSGRLKFKGAASSAPFPSMIVIMRGELPA